jgi:carbamoylphosphate synthase small subunit
MTGYQEILTDPSYRGQVALPRSFLTFPATGAPVKISIHTLRNIIKPVFMVLIPEHLPVI